MKVCVIFKDVGLKDVCGFQIPIVAPQEASILALQYRKRGFETLKLKVGKNLKTDIEVLQAIRAVHPTCSFILDANEGYQTEEAVRVLETLHGKQVSESFWEFSQLVIER